MFVYSAAILCVCVFRRYRKQMEEMQRAFNKTIIKLQNTSRIAEEQVGPPGCRSALLAADQPSDGG